jgi:hypothetical protein
MTGGSPEVGLNEAGSTRMVAFPCPVAHCQVDKEHKLGSI